MIQHKMPECTGSWRLTNGWIACTRCWGRAADTPEERRAALDENYAAITLKRLATEGAAILQNERAA